MSITKEMTLRKLLEDYFISYPSSEEEEEDVDRMKAMSDEEFGEGVVKAFEKMKERLRECQLRKG